MTRKTQLFFGVLAILAVIGLLQMLRQNPTGVLLMFAFAAIVIFAVKFLMGRKSAPDPRYQQALRRQKKMAQKKKHSKLRKDIPFKVIEGKKGKSKENKPNVH